jgi:poly(3-hydroxybutyrate) depolymerase
MFGGVNSVTAVFIASSATGDNLEATPLERSYKCHVLGHYPESVLWNPFDKNAVGMVSLVFILHGSAMSDTLHVNFFRNADNVSNGMSRVKCHDQVSGTCDPGSECYGIK